MRTTDVQKRRNKPSGSRSAASTRAVRVLAAGLAIAALGAGTGAYADTIRFDNPSGPEHFVWYGGTAGNPIGLEIISDAASQTGAFGGVAQFHQALSDNGSSYVSGGLGGGELEVGGMGDYFLVGAAFGQLIPTGAPWDDGGYIWYPGYDSQLPEGEPTYLAVRFPLDDGTHYGWIGVVRGGASVPGLEEYELDTFAWGYETEPGVPIEAGIPEPGTLAMLAFGAGALLATRRRRSQLD